MPCLQRTITCKVLEEFLPLIPSFASLVSYPFKSRPFRLHQVLSVVATQVKTIQDCIKKFAVVSNRDPEYQHLPPGLPPVKLGNFIFEGDMISLTPTCGFYITMNPGYAGRTELPENLKVLFRSCAMIRPDLKLICENMLMSEGFQGARVLAIKFVTLYELSSELLSKQAHYDW